MTEDAGKAEIEQQPAAARYHRPALIRGADYGLEKKNNNNRYIDYILSQIRHNELNCERRFI
ncbi:MAG: hypothetical protein ISP42_05865 [Alphaproteobacteria bacterium]|nr:hypothetical protein [Alphaproteobacteria bacterium]